GGGGVGGRGWVDWVLVPGALDVGLALGEIGPQAFRLLGETLLKALVAYALSVSLGVGVGLVVGTVRYLYDVLNPFLVALYAIPKILVLPWILLTFGLGLTPAIVYGILQGFFPISLLLAAALRAIAPH